MKVKSVIVAKNSKKARVECMGKFDEEPKKKSKRQSLMIFGLIVFLIGTYFVLFSVDEERPMCDEVIELMLDDTDHLRLHESYPNIMMSLHSYMDNNCNTVNEDNPMGISP